MSGARSEETIQISRRFGVETPEHVVLEFELAGVGSRAAAAILDAIIIGLIVLLLSLVVLPIAGLLGSWGLAIWIALTFLVLWGYYVFFEALGSGTTPGKRRVGIRVVMDTGHPVTFAAAAIRNLVRLVDAQPLPTYLLGSIFALFHGEHKRLGDLVAGTIVVRDRADGELQVAAKKPDDALVEAGPPVLSDDEFQLLERFLERLDALSSPARVRLSGQLVTRFADRFTKREPDPDAFLARVYSEELAKRQDRAAIRVEGGVVRASGTVQRFVALRSDRWERFRQEAAGVEKRGLKYLDGRALRQFAAAYREVAADLARARTYGVDERVLGYLERTVSAGHNALYGLRGVRRYSLRRLLLAELPAAVVKSRRYVFAAALLFLVPGFVGYFVLGERPELAIELLPQEVIERAELGRAQLEQGRGYGETPSLYLPVVATGIVANNVQVAFAAFAFGITAGVGTVFVLVFNGLFFGSVLALFDQYGLATWLLTFVAGHGVLELTAIYIAGAAGLIVGHAVVAPGDLTRGDALVVRGAVAIRLVGASASLLLLAGTIEGFLSASDAPVTLKLGVSAASLLLLILYLYAGYQESARAAIREANGGREESWVTPAS